jgi:hypothetical protein
MSLRTIALLYAALFLCSLATTAGLMPFELFIAAFGLVIIIRLASFARP